MAAIILEFCQNINYLSTALVQQSKKLKGVYKTLAVVIKKFYLKMSAVHYAWYDKINKNKFFKTAFFKKALKIF